MTKLLSAVVLAALCACGGDVSQPASPPTVVRVEVAVPAASLFVAATVQATATAFSSQNVAIGGLEFTWASDDPSIAAVSNTGLITAKSPGTTVVRASNAGVSGTLPVTVTLAPVAAVVLAPDTATLTIGSAATVVATLRDANGNELTGRPITFSSSDTSIATIRPTGVISAVSPGTVTITAEAEGKRATVTRTVVRGALPRLALQQVATGIDARFLASPPGDSRQFLAGADGRIWILENDKVLPEPFLDIRTKVNQGINGVYSIAFHPKFATNGAFFVDYVDANLNNRIERFTVSSDRNRADASSGQAVLTVIHPPPFDHYGGWMAFGPDGKLFIITGDGGPGNSANAQDKTTLLGKLLRLDVDGAAPYVVPPDNPFVGVTGVRPEIWAFGVRNPFRDSFDRVTGALYVADVGQDDWEEINVVSSSRAGADYGWNRLEGSHCSPLSTSGCAIAGSVLPVLEYSHPGRPGAVGASHPTGCSVTGGYVYRGNRIPALRGHYFYGDFCGGWIRSFRVENGVAVDQQQWFDTVGSIVSFGEDSSGELYILTIEGKTFRIISGP